MAQQPEDPAIPFDDVPPEDARRMSRGARMEHTLYATLTKKIQALAGDTVRVRLGPKIKPERMRRYIQRIAHELTIPVTVRCVVGGVIFWRTTEAKKQQAQDVAGQLQRAQRKAKPARPRRGRQRNTPRR
jgi:hypothetical protein